MYNWPKSVGCGACNGQRATRQLLYYPLSYMFVHIHIGWMVCMKSLGECRFCSSNHRSFRVRACVRVRVRLSPQRFLYRIYATFFYDYINNNGNAMVAQLLFASALKLAAAARIKKKRICIYLVRPRDSFRNNNKYSTVTAREIVFRVLHGMSVLTFVVVAAAAFIPFNELIRAHR